MTALEILGYTAVAVSALCLLLILCVTITLAVRAARTTNQVRRTQLTEAVDRIRRRNTTWH